MSERSVGYQVTVGDPHQHMLDVSVVVRGDALPEPLVVAMPVWTPGSYLVREYARHVEALRATGDGVAAGVRKLRKDTWAIAHGGAREVTVTYRVYARDLTVRTCYIDDTLVWINGAAAFIRPVEEGFDWDALPCELALSVRVPGAVVTALDAREEGRWCARSYHELVDSPIAVGDAELRRFEVAGREHLLAVWGGARAQGYTAERLERDLARIVEAEVSFFGGAPYDRYVFFVFLVVGGRGGLEHGRCTAVMASPDCFEADESYHDLLSLLAHEFFHLWNVKRIVPAGLAPIDYARENHTRLLWLFEGATSYYDWQFLRRAGVVTPAQYLRHLAAEVTAVEETPGRFEQTLEEASFDAWLKLYRPDEHTLNSTVSYYRKGELACALLDLEIRVRSDGQRSLDDVMRHLWREHGLTGRPVPEQNFEALVAAATDVDVSDMVDRCIRTTDPLPYAEGFAHAGLSLRARPGRGATLGLRLRVEGGRVMVAAVLRGGPGAAAGVCPGDEIIGFQGRRVDENALRERLRRGASLAGREVSLLVARRDELRTLGVVPADAPPESHEIFPREGASPGARKLAECWLTCASSALWNGETA